jgi:proteasome lid subunit RPN8/RPN11
MKNHALEEYPLESCGLLLKDGSYERATNESSNPENSFEIDAVKVAMRRKEIYAIIHSHPNGPHYPSKSDMQSQINLDIPYGIIVCSKEVAQKPFFFGDALGQRPGLIQRPFQHGITDCYALIRDFYYEHGIIVPDIPRDWEWWDDGLNLYEDFLEYAGFSKIKNTNYRYGDIGFAKIRSKVVNHAGILLNSGLFLHHPCNGGGYSTSSVSKRDPLNRYLKHIEFWARYKDDIPSRNIKY